MWNSPKIFQDLYMESQHPLLLRMYWTHRGEVCWLQGPEIRLPVSSINEVWSFTWRFTTAFSRLYKQRCNCHIDLAEENSKLQHTSSTSLTRTLIEKSWKYCNIHAEPDVAKYDDCSRRVLDTFIISGSRPKQQRMFQDLWNMPLQWF